MLIAGLLALAMQTATLPAMMDNGGDVYTVCDETNAAFDPGYCSAWLDGLISGSTVMLKVVDQDAPWCIPETLSLGAIARAAVHELRKDPGLWSQTAAMAGIVALTKAYPCATSAE